MALQLLPQLEEMLREEVRGMGIDPEQVSGSCVDETFVGMVGSHTTAQGHWQTYL